MALDIALGQCHDDAQNELKHMYVIAVINNPLGWNRRYDLFQKFLKHMKALGAQLLVVECVYGELDHVVCSDGHHENVFGDTAASEDGSWVSYVRVKAESVLWHKENLINIGISRLPANARYVAWIDADVFFTRQDVLLMAVRALQTYSVIQLWSHCSDLGPQCEVMNIFESFGHAYMNMKPRKQFGTGSDCKYAHTGFAWAARMDVLNNIGGLFDRAVLGSGDHHMALSFIGLPSVRPDAPKSYRDAVDAYTSLCELYVNRNLGCIPGMIQHGFHGTKKNRKYVERWAIINNTNFDITSDIAKNRYGVYELVYNDPKRKADVTKFRDFVRLYFAQRNEDATTNDT